MGENLPGCECHVKNVKLLFCDANVNENSPRLTFTSRYIKLIYQNEWGKIFNDDKKEAGFLYVKKFWLAYFAVDVLCCTVF